MPGLIEPDRYDLVFIATSVALVIFAYVIYPTEIARVAAWATIFFMQVCWVGYIAYRWTWDEDAQV